jgi:hypothetical protein
LFAGHAEAAGSFRGRDQDLRAARGAFSFSFRHKAFGILKVKNGQDCSKAS